MPVAHPTAMLSTAWYWSLALGGCALYTAHNAACVGQGRALVVLPQALAGRDAVHVVAHVLFEHALVVPGVLFIQFIGGGWGGGVTHV